MHQKEYDLCHSVKMTRITPEAKGGDSFYARYAQASNPMHTTSSMLCAHNSANRYGYGICPAFINKRIGSAVANQKATRRTRQAQSPQRRMNISCRRVNVACK